MDDCSKYWALSDFLPIDEVVAFWCGVKAEELDSLHYETQCVKARRSAILNAAHRGEIKFTRNDGKDFNDPVYRLHDIGVLLIERESFECWRNSLGEDLKAGGDLPLPKNGLTPNERNSLLKIVLGMAMAKYGYNPEASRNSATGENKNSILADIQEIGLSIDSETIKKYLDEASEKFYQNRLPWDK